jgi:endonuclease/exonuclease/phosphatase family metal-dependent hydrolase
LDNTSRGTRFWRSFGAGRARQARALLEALDGEEPVALGGDLNTWFGQSREEAVAVLRGRFAFPSRLPEAATYSPPYGLPTRQTDYLLLRASDEWEASYRVARDWRNSDHAPLVGSLERRQRAYLMKRPTRRCHSL